MRRRSWARNTTEPEADRRHGAEVGRHKWWAGRRRVVQKRPPGLAGRLSWPDHILADVRFIRGRSSRRRSCPVGVTLRAGAALPTVDSHGSSFESTRGPSLTRSAFPMFRAGFPYPEQRKPIWCQARTVSGWTMNSADRYSAPSSGPPRPEPAIRHS
jgi:hypothetical protein